MVKNFIIALFLAFILDVADLFGGFIPIAGDILDVVGILLLYPLIGVYALLASAEFIPMVDLLPTFLWSVFAWKMDILHRRSRDD